MPRTRSASAHRKVLDAALDLVAARGLEATSMDAIAAPIIRLFMLTASSAVGRITGQRDGSFRCRHRESMFS